MANIDKVKLEQMIDEHLQQEIPLSFLMEKYKLTYPQMKLLINRANGYVRKTNSLYQNHPNPSYDNVSQSYIAIPHEVREEYPFCNEEQIELFKKLEELKNSVPVVSKDIIRMIEEEISNCQKALQEVNMSEIAKAEKVAQEIANMGVNGDDFEDIFRRNFLTPQDFQYLNQVYTNYLSLQEKYRTLREKRAEAENDLKTAKKMNREIEDIRTDLVVHNMKLVNFCTRTFFNGILLPQDEVQLYGIEGLAKAINNFDPKLGFQFSTYAVPTIVHTIELHFKEMTGLEWRDFCRKQMIRYYRDWYRNEISDESFELSAKALAESGLVPLTEKVIANNDKLIDQVVPLADIQEPFEDETEYGRRKFPATFEEYDSIDTYTDAYESGFDSIEKQFNEIKIKDITDVILEVLTTLPVRNAQVLILRFGLEDGVQRTLHEIAQIFNVTDERIRQVEAKGLRLLRQPSRVHKLRGLVEYFDDVVELDDIPSIEGSKRFR